MMLKLCQNDLEIDVRRDKLDPAHRVAGSSNNLKFFRERRKLDPKKILINENIRKENHKLLLHLKRRCPEEVSVYSVDGATIARTSDWDYRIKRKEDVEKYGLTMISMILRLPRTKKLLSTEHLSSCLYIYHCSLNIIVQQHQQAVEEPYFSLHFSYG